MLKKLHLAAVGSAAVTILGLVTSPMIAGMFPAKVSDVLIAGGIFLQAITKGVQQGNTTLVEKSPTP